MYYIIMYMTHNYVTYIYISLCTVNFVRTTKVFTNMYYLYNRNVINVHK